MRRSSLDQTKVAMSREIGSEYENIKSVSRNMPTIKVVADNLPQLGNLATEIGEAEAELLSIKNDIALGAMKGEKGDKGDTGPVGAVGAKGSTGNVGPVGSPGPKGDSGPAGPRGLTGATGAKGDSVAVTQVTSNPDHTLTITFSDGTQHTTDNLRGPTGQQGAHGVDGDTGPRGFQGYQGLSMKGLRRHSTTHTYGFYGRPGETDTYAVLGFDHILQEVVTLDYIDIFNGRDGDMSSRVYDMNQNGIVDDSERLEGRTLEELLNIATQVVKTLEERDALEDLSVGSLVLVENIGDFTWALYMVIRQENDPEIEVTVLDGGEAVVSLAPVFAGGAGADADFTETLDGGGIDARHFLLVTDQRSYDSVDIATTLTTTAQTLPQGINELNLLKYDKTGGLVDGDVTITGNLTVQGVETAVHTDDMYVSDNVMVVNHGEVGAGVSLGWAGLQVDRGTVPDYQFVFEEATGTFRVGEIGLTQPVATREDAPLDGKAAIWSSAERRFKTDVDLLASNVYDSKELQSVQLTLNGVMTSLRNTVVNVIGDQTIDGVKTFLQPVVGDGSLLVNLEATNITTGIVDPERLPRASSTKDGIITSADYEKLQLMQVGADGTVSGPVDGGSADSYA